MSAYLDPADLTPQKCKENSVKSLRAYSELRRSRLEKRWSSDDRWYAVMLLDEAQVWATLATVPDKARVDVAETQASVFPVLTCPHGYRARIDTIEAEGRPVQLRYAFAECDKGCP